MSRLFELLAGVTEDLERAGVVYALTGSLASSLHGQARQSLDADIVLRLDAATARQLAQRWLPRFYVSEEGLVEAIAHAGMTNLLDAASGLKIDLSILSETPYHAQVLARRRGVVLPTKPVRTVQVVSPEDIVVMKLEWRKDTRSQRQYEDALGVVRTHGAALDWAFMKHWARTLGIADDLAALQRDAGLD